MFLFSFLFLSFFSSVISKYFNISSFGFLRFLSFHVLLLFLSSHFFLLYSSSLSFIFIFLQCSLSLIAKLFFFCSLFFPFVFLLFSLLYICACVPVFLHAAVAIKISYIYWGGGPNVEKRTFVYYDLMTGSEYNRLSLITVDSDVFTVSHFLFISIQFQFKCSRLLYSNRFLSRTSRQRTSSYLHP